MLTTQQPTATKTLLILLTLSMFSVLSVNCTILQLINDDGDGGDDEDGGPITAFAGTGTAETVVGSGVSDGFGYPIGNYLIGQRVRVQELDWVLGQNNILDEDCQQSHIYADQMRSIDELDELPQVQDINQQYQPKQYIKKPFSQTTQQYSNPSDQTPISSQTPTTPASTPAPTPTPTIPEDVKYDLIDCKESFNDLSDKNALYAYHFTRAAWAGAPICFFQRSYESPAMLYVILRGFGGQGVDVSGIARRIERKMDKSTVNKILTYIAAFLESKGNYKSFGDTKFVPECSESDFVKFWIQTPYWSKEKQKFNEIWKQIRQFVFNYQAPYGNIQFSDKNGTSGYYSKNCTSSDAQKVKEFMVSQGLLPQNTRLVKVSDTQFIVKIASIDKIQQKTLISPTSLKLTLKYGQFTPFLQQITKHLSKVQQYTSTIPQKAMLDKYLQHFKTGDMTAFKQSQAEWVRDKQPTIEVNIGFVESYLDPLKVRAEYQGIVAIVNRKESEILGRLVERAGEFVGLLPWGREFEVEEFVKPDFTSLEVLAFSSSLMPIGINLPNFDDIRQKVGFKNVNLGNVYGTPTPRSIKFTPESSIPKLLLHSQSSTFLMVALHQLLGHGSGKLLRQAPSFPNPLDNSPITSFYTQNQTYESLFGEVNSIYQQCRADAVALYLALFEEVQEVVLDRYGGREREEIVEVLWYGTIVKGLKALEYYNLELGKWGESHMAGYFAIFNVLRDKGGIFDIVQTQRNNKPYLQIILHKNQYKTRGKQAISNFLKHLQIYKSIADAQAGTKYLNQYLQITDQYRRYKKIVDDNKSARGLDIQPYLSLGGGREQGYGEGLGQKPVYHEFKDTVEDCIRSYVLNIGDGYGDKVEEIYEQWVSQNQDFRY